MLNMRNNKKVCLITLGCPKNEYDSDCIRHVLEENDFLITKNIKKADVVIINTCCFIDHAKEESIETILDVAQLKEEKSFILIVFGCMPQRYYKELSKEIPEVDGWVGLSKMSSLPNVISTISKNRLYLDKKIKYKKCQKNLVEKQNFIFKPICLVENVNDWVKKQPKRKFYGKLPYTYLKIADGCDHTCTFCDIPNIKGKHESRIPKEIIKEAKELVNNNIKEIILISQDITQYGKDLEEKTNLVRLLNDLIKIDNLKRIRLMYLNPGGINDDLINLISKGKKLCKYLDIPIQHVNNKILRKMGRRGSYDEFLKLFSRVREKIPEIVFRCSIIIGFPGETESDYDLLCKFLKKAKLDWVGFFKFSPQEGTKAYYYNNKIDKKTVDRRYNDIVLLQNEISMELREKLVGKTLKVLIEQSSIELNNYWEGRSYREAPEIDGLIFVEKDGVVEGDLIPIKITNSQFFDLYGKINKH